MGPGFSGGRGTASRGAVSLCIRSRHPTQDRERVARFSRRCGPAENRRHSAALKACRGARLERNTKGDGLECESRR